MLGSDDVRGARDYREERGGYLLLKFNELGKLLIEIEGGLEEGDLESVYEMGCGIVDEGLTEHLDFRRG